MGVMKLVTFILLGLSAAAFSAEVGVGTKPAEGADVLFDGTRKSLDTLWTYWQGPNFASALPIKWKIVADPVDKGEVLMSFDPVSDGGKYGTADIVTQKAYGDFRLHLEFLVMKPGGNSGVYLQNRFEMQIFDGDETTHGMGAIINEEAAPQGVYLGVGKWNAYDIQFRAARFKDGKRVEQPLVTVYLNGQKIHKEHAIQQVWGGPNSGVDGGNDGGKGITDSPQGLKLQSEGHDIRFRNIWIKPLALEKPVTDF
ncbi:MAG: hypothetical protein JWO82_4294 [Akkermansiaceae bacterium]|nr:hypothetical protein [Akkermansiaceae bacterium]